MFEMMFGSVNWFALLPASYVHVSENGKLTANEVVSVLSLM